VAENRFFTLDIADGFDGPFEAVSFGKPWNGWLTPVVTRETLERLFPLGASGDMQLTFTADGVAHIDEDESPVDITPDANGHYDLAHLGWTFVEDPQTETKTEEHT